MRLPNRISLALVSVAFASAALPAIAQELPAEESVQAPENNDMQALVDEVGEVAQKVSAKNEEVKQLEDDLAAQQARVDDLAAQARAAAQAADAARSLPFEPTTASAGFAGLPMWAWWTVGIVLALVVLGALGAALRGVRRG